MTSFPFPSQMIQPDAEQAARRLRLPFSCCAWKGTQGHWEGTGAGNSIDFQGSRSYQWGDDPRDIHWAAYARTGQLTMKVFRAELSPQVDVAVDVSESMFFHEERAARTRGLLQFCLLSAIGTGAQVKIHAVKGRRIIPLDQEDVLSGQWEAQLQSLPPDESMPSISIWRPNGMKIFISDLLYPGEPDNLLETMASLKGMSVILAPTLQEEAELPAGNARLKNCESGHLRRQTVLARVPCKGTLTEALSGEALRQGAVELS